MSEGPITEPYVVSDQRLAEIRAMFDPDPDESFANVAPGVSREMLAWAVYDLLAERDTRA